MYRHTLAEAGRSEVSRTYLVAGRRSWSTLVRVLRRRARSRRGELSHDVVMKIDDHVPQPATSSR